MKNTIFMDQCKKVTLGLPKHDKVKLARKKNIPLPKAWADLVKRKIVILYAMTIHDQLKKYERTIRKVELSIDFFTT